ncbi:hypothetical protein LPB140_02485 [Sphingorhabdus lutea]|uniref:Amidohydrolase n=2 Tax=Sphingorhabdus lutea TaxID=1913578 RepID=A0A1L3J9T4_9SPHN|nr:hypothetical protein LPB140_02485 [Sphingorhabdus lutea]
MTSPQTTLIQNVQIFDGVRNIGTSSVLIKDDKIADIDFKGDVKDAQIIIDGTDLTLLPGMIDSHVHAMMAMDTPLLFGVTTQLDMFTPPTVNADIRAKTKNGENKDVADLYSAGFLATAPGGHGTQFGVSVPTLTTPQEADSWVKSRIEEGSDFIKIVREPGSSFGRPLPTLDSATTKALIKAAHDNGKLAVVHVQDYDSAFDTISSGADGLVHMFFDKSADDAIIALAKEKGVFITPTYSVFEGFHGRKGTASLLRNENFAGLLPEIAKDNINQSFGPDRSAKLDANMAQSISAFANAGVLILAGTDAGNPGVYYGISMHRELQLLVKAGLSPAQALSAATANPAKAYKLTDRGRIANGMKADLLLVKGDPTKDITATRNIIDIWKDGQSAKNLILAKRAEISNLISNSISGENSGANNAALAGETAKQTAAVNNGILGNIANFHFEGEGVKITAPFGIGWDVNSDVIMGGGSTATLSKGREDSLRISGSVKKGSFAQWAGIAFVLGDTPFAPKDISAASAMTFRIRGTGGGFAVMAFSQKSGQMPNSKNFTVTDNWQDIRINFADLGRFQAANATLLTISAIMPGDYDVEIKDIAFIDGE